MKINMKCFKELNTNPLGRFEKPHVLNVFDVFDGPFHLIWLHVIFLVQPNMSLYKRLPVALSTFDFVTCVACSTSQECQ